MPETAQFGWPALLPTRLACTYCSTSRRTLLRAVRAGALAIAGKRGRTWIFERADLDAWMRSMPAESPAPAPRQREREVRSASVETALARLRSIVPTRRASGA